MRDEIRHGFNKMKRFSVQYYLDGLKEGNNVILAQSITLVESQRESDRKLANSLLDQLTKMPKKALRIGISGTPGVGKSSFIESFGSFLISLGKKIAVLAIDPSSQKTGGSILGDKTRMELLSRNSQAFIRPSASGKKLGGVNNKTREAILLCEAAAFDIIIIETVGVGQSETLVNNMVDFFLLMLQPGAGDDLQGIKKGIMEMADGIVINKADGEQKKLANLAKIDVMHALHLYAPNEYGWTTTVTLCSAIERNGLSEVWDVINDFVTLMIENGHFDLKRKKQDISWFDSRVEFDLIKTWSEGKRMTEARLALVQKIQTNEVSVSSAVKQMIEVIKTEIINLT